MKIIDILVGAYSDQSQENTSPLDTVTTYSIKHGNRPTQYFSSAEAVKAYCLECDEADRVQAKQRSAIDQATGRNKEYLQALEKGPTTINIGETYFIALITSTGNAHYVPWQTWTARDTWKADKLIFKIPAGVTIIGIVALDKKHIIRVAVKQPECEYPIDGEYTASLRFTK